MSRLKGGGAEIIPSEPVNFYRKDVEILTLVFKVSRCSYEEHWTDTVWLFLDVCFVKSLCGFEDEVHSWLNNKCQGILLALAGPARFCGGNSHHFAKCLHFRILS